VPDLQFPALAGRLCRARLHAGAVARFRPGRSRRRSGRIQPSRAPFRRRDGRPRSQGGRSVTDGAPQPPRPAPSELRLRSISAVVLGAGVLLTTYFGGWPFTLVWTLVAGLIAYEWLSIVSQRNAVAGGIGVALAGFALSFWPASPAAIAGVAAFAALTGAVATPMVRDKLGLEACGVAYALVFALV